MSFRYGLRFFAKQPAFTALIVMSLGVGIGLTAAIGAIADALLFRPLPVARPNELVRIYTASAGQPLGFVSYPDYRDLRAASRTPSGMVAQSQVLVAVGGDQQEVARVRLGLAVTPNYFDVLGVRAALGRTFRVEEDREPVAVLAYRYWEWRYRTDKEALGRTIRIGGTDFVVIGVAPKNFGLDRFVHEDFYVPMGIYDTGLLPSRGRPLEDRSRRYLTVYGRLRPGIKIGQTQAELNTLAGRLESEHPEEDRGRRAVALTELASRMRSDSTMTTLARALLLVAAVVLAIGCANAAGLLLVRGEARARETAVRVAMGAPKLRLLLDLLSESIMLAVAGAVAGIPLGWAATRVLMRSVTLPTDLPFAVESRMDGRAMLLAGAVTTLAALVCGLAPWLVTRKADAAAVLRYSGTARSGSRSRMRSVLVIVEIALAVMLVSTGGMLLRSMKTAEKIDLGYRMDHVLVLVLDPAQIRYREDQTRVFYNLLTEKIRHLPGVRAAALAQSVPLGVTGAQRDITIDDESAGRASGERRTVWMNIVSPGYFELMHIQVAAGRTFDARDRANGHRVVIINEALAKLMRVRRSFRMDGETIEVIGVVRTAKYFQLSESPRPYMYLPYSQNYASRMVLHVETEGQPEASAMAVTREVRQLDASQPISEVRSLDQYFSDGALFAIRAGLYVLTVVGTCGLLLALGGLYSVIASTVERRRREFGIRAALGASEMAVVRLVVSHGVRLATIGSIAGIATALGGSRLTSTLIPSGSGADWRVLGSAALVVVAISLTACAIPTLRACGIEPAVALRDE